MNDGDNDIQVVEATGVEAQAIAVASPEPQEELLPGGGNDTKGNGSAGLLPGGGNDTKGNGSAG